MAMYPDENQNKEEYVELHCFTCDKYCGLYFRKKPIFFEELFFCSFKCQSDHVKKKGQNLQNGN